MKVKYCLFFIFLLFNLKFLMGEEMFVLENGSFDLWKDEKPVSWKIKNCVKTKKTAVDGYAVCFLENGEISQNLKNIVEKKKYRLEFTYRLPDYGTGYIRWKISGVKGKNLSGRVLTPYFHTKPIRVVKYFYVDEITENPSITFYGGGKNSRTILDELTIAPVDGGYTGVYLEKIKKDEAIAIFSISNYKNHPKTYKYKCEIVNYFMEEIFKKEGKISLSPGEYKSFKIPFKINNSIRYRAKIEVVDENGLFKEDVSFIESNDIGKFRKIIRIPNKNWKFCLLNKDFSLQTDKKNISLPYTISTPGESFYRAIRFGQKVDNEKNWYGLFEKEIFIPDFNKNERIFIEIPRAMNSPEIYINGKKAGKTYGRVPLVADITEYVKPGEINNFKIIVGTWKTGYDWKGNEIIMKLPYSGSHQGILSFNNYIKILPSIRIENVYIRTSYREKKIFIEYTLRNDTQHPAVVSVLPKILDNGKVAKLFKKGEVLVRGESSVKVIFEEKWEKPKLWMPREPYLYRLKTSLFIRKEKIDEQNIRFGFREIWTEGKKIFWNGKDLKLITRLSFPHPLHAGMELNLDTQWRALRQYTDNNIWFSRGFTIGDPFFLDLCDEMGYVIRLSYELNAAFGDWRQKISKEDSFWKIMEEHVRKLTVENRNHSSILCWSVENETFLCGLGEQQPWTIKKYKKLREIVRGIHPGILLEHDGSEPENDVEIINLHYPLNPARTIPYSPVFPPEIFEKDKWYGLQLYPGSLLWDEKKPLVLGEDFIGFPEVPQSLSILNDEDCYDVLENNPRRGKDYEKFDKFYHQLHLPFMKKVRERELAYFTTWPITDTGWSDTLKPVAIFVDEVFRNLKSSERFNLTITINYDLLKDIRTKLIWEYKDENGKLLNKRTKDINLKAGDVKKIKVILKNPLVKRNTKTTSLFIKLLSEDKKLLAKRGVNFRVYPELSFPEIPFILYDVYGETARTLKKLKLNFIEKKYPEEGKLFIIGKNSFTQENISKIKNQIINHIKNGGKVFVFEQKKDIKSILPFELRCNSGTFSFKGFKRVLDHPIVKGIENEELSFWRKTTYISSNCYWKPVSGNFLPIIDTGRLGGFLTTPLIEVYIGKGSIIFSQLSLTENLGIDPVADKIFSNLLKYSIQKPYRHTEKSLRIIGSSKFIQNIKNSNLFKISEKSDIYLVDGTLKDQKLIKSILEEGKKGKTVWIKGINEDTQKLWEKAGIKGLKIKKKELFSVIKKRYDSVIAGLSNTDLFWFGMKLAPLPGEWYSTGTAPIIEYECEIENGIEIIDKGSFIKLPLGKGLVIIDNLTWDKYINDDSNIKSKRIPSLIGTNLGISVNPDFQSLIVDEKKLKFYPVDMSSVYNEELNDVFKNHNGIFGGVPFIIKPSEKGCLLLGSKNLTQPEPKLKPNVELKIEEKFDVIYFLTTAYDPYEGGQGYGTGEMYGGIEFVYDDGSNEKISLLHKVHSVNIFEYMGDLLKGKLVWRGPTPFKNWWDMYTRWPGNRWIQKEHPNNIYLVRWLNPHPEKRIEKINIFSTNVHVVPAIIGITGGKYEK